MKAFSRQSLQVVEDFARSLDLRAEASPDGSFSFAFEYSGTFTLTASGDGKRTIASLSRWPVREEARGELRLLECAGLEPTSSTLLHAGLARDGSYVVSIQIDQDALDLPRLDTVFRQLAQTQEQVFSNRA